MAFTHGSSTKLLWDGYELTSYFRSASTDASRDTAETSAFGDGAKTYIKGLKDGTLSAEGMWDSSAGASSDVLQAALDGDAAAIVTVLPEGDAVGAGAHGLEGPATSYAITSTVDDVEQVSVEAQASTGIEPLVSLMTVHEEAAGSYDGTSVDNGASSSDGAVAYLHAPDVQGTLDVKVQDSDDDVTFVDLITFTQATADNASERVAVTGTVERYLRVQATVATGPATFHVAAGRRPNNAT